MLEGSNLRNFGHFLHQHPRFEDDDSAQLLKLSAQITTERSSAYIIKEGNAVETVITLVSGHAFQQKLTPAGSRQITHVFLPGEPLNFDSLFFSHSYCSVIALTDVQLIAWKKNDFRELTARVPNLFGAIFTTLAVQASMLQERLLMIGRRAARDRVAHFLCEYAARCEAAGLSKADGSFFLPMTQEQIGDALGLTSVHVNRTIRSLESEGLIQRFKYRVAIPQFAELASIGSFERGYLQL